jgi:hypothetical protein
MTPKPILRLSIWRRTHGSKMTRRPRYLLTKADMGYRFVV